jgi:endonuclease/exonuclease/phosphatase family metal-dependent hydrolase
MSASESAASESAESKKEILAAIDKITPPRLEKRENIVRFATYNISFHRNAEGELSAELAKQGSEQAAQIAEIIQRVRPDVILLNEFDFDAANQGLVGFLENYLGVSQQGQEPIEYPYWFTAPVNTGVDSGMDYNADGVLGSPEDAFGYGAYPGQYGMAVLSKFPIETDRVRTFQKFLWKDMPDPLWPMDPATGQSYYSEEIKQVFRLSSKSHWDVPIRIGDQVVHLLASHPTPPVFDGPEDRNGCRNHDEIRFWVDYLSGLDYMYDDDGRKGGLAPDAKFVIAGDLNADPVDGDSRDAPILPLLNHPRVNYELVPHSQGGVYHALAADDANRRHQGNPAHDTANFNPAVGNLRVDYCLPSKNLTANQAGIYWPVPEEVGANLVTASDHRLVWVDIEMPQNAQPILNSE